MSLDTSYDIPVFRSTVEKSISWRLWHSINFLIGGTSFILASIFYYPFLSSHYNGYVIGGWLFTIGSLAFLLADFTEWNHFKLGCIGNAKAHYSNNSFYAKFKRAEIGINFFCSMIGSFYYLLGSIFFIPETNMLNEGEIFFIIGSFVIFFSQSWKCIRTAFTNQEDEKDCTFRSKNIFYDFSGFNVDMWAGIGGLMYAIGTLIFRYMINSQQLLIAVHFFVAGGTGFTLSGICMQYRYYCSSQIKSNNSYEEISQNS